ncbi:hypothetical protein N7G274_008128 [Stereocaulon virgatum]|uniref:Multiple myeloma tumor-associated protein 2-like N-terminal domain-containing protein n=1 Tax=Stereocaulon virgatum TaxID=373712 RepID=A0ABR4A2U3_9LECA
MDLVAGVRKEGSRGGRGDFKWEDVQSSQHRENYLGHSLMAPVGRWQKNKDLSWYAKADTSPAALTAAEQRREEIRKIKEAEESALSEALGYGPTISKNTNETPIGKKEVERAIRETAEGEEEEGTKGVGFGGFEGVAAGRRGEVRDVLDGVGVEAGAGDRTRSRTRDGEGRMEKRRRRSGSRNRSRERQYRRHTHGDDRSHRRHRSRDRSRRRSRNGYSHRRERARSYERRRGDDKLPRRTRERSYSPDPRRQKHHSNDRNHGYRP